MRRTRFASPRFRGGKRGTVLIVVLGVLSVLSVMGTTFALMMATERSAARQYQLGFKAETLAQDGIEHAVLRLQRVLSGDYPTFGASPKNHYSRLDPDVHFGAMFTSAIGPMVDDRYSYRSGVLRDGVSAHNIPGVHGTDWYQVGDYDIFGARSITEQSIPVAFPYGSFDNVEEAPFIDLGGTGTYEESLDALLEELYDATEPAYKPVFFDEERDRMVFSGFTHEGRYHTDSGILAGTRTPGGNRFRLKVISANSQLPLNHIGRTLYDRIAYDSNQDGFIDGTGFRYMLHFLGLAIAREHPELCVDIEGVVQNPFSREIVEQLWELRQQSGHFSSKEQIRDIIERETRAPRIWQAVRDYVTVHAWPGHDPVGAVTSPNAYRPTVSIEEYREKVGYHERGTTQVENSLLPNPSSADVQPVTLPPVEVNTAPFPVLYATLANLAGDSRFYHYTRERLLINEDTIVDPFIDGDQDFDRYNRAVKFYRGDLPDVGWDDPYARDDEEDELGWRYWYQFAQSTEQEERRVWRLNWDLTRDTGAALTGDDPTPFDRVLGMLHQVRIDPFRASFSQAEAPGEQVQTGVLDADFAWNLAKAIETERDIEPFTSWADFDRRFIQRYIVEEQGQYRGRAICLPFADALGVGYWEHPMNVNHLGTRSVDWIEREPEIRTWYYESVADLLRAAMQPAAKENAHNPDANYYQRVSRADLVYWTVPFTFEAPGIFEVTSVGEVLGEVFDPIIPGYTLRPIAQRQFRAVVKLADIVRHQDQLDFDTGLPAAQGPFLSLADASPSVEHDTEVGIQQEADRFYSQVRLTAFSGTQTSSELYPPGTRSLNGVPITDVGQGKTALQARQSTTATYPRPRNQDVRYMRVLGHEVPVGNYPNTMEEKVYYTGFRSWMINPRLHGPSQIEENRQGTPRPGYVALRPQDSSPFDPEMRMRPEGEGLRYLGRGVTNISVEPIIDEPAGTAEAHDVPDADIYSIFAHESYEGETPQGLLLQDLQAGEPDEARYLLFWMPFNETIDTAASVEIDDDVMGYGYRYGAHQTAVIPSVGGEVLDPQEYFPHDRYDDKHYDTYQRWTPGGFTFRAFDRGTNPHMTNSFAHRFGDNIDASHFQNSHGVTNMPTHYQTNTFNDGNVPVNREVVQFPFSLLYPAGLNFEGIYDGQTHDDLSYDSTIAVDRVITLMNQDYNEFEGTRFVRASDSQGWAGIDGSWADPMLPGWMLEAEPSTPSDHDHVGPLYGGMLVSTLDPDPDDPNEWDFSWGPGFGSAVSESRYRNINYAQHLFQTRTNFPHYHGTVEFWFKSDMDQWDTLVTATGSSHDNPPAGPLAGDESRFDAFLGGFLAATTIVHRRADGEDWTENKGIQGVQTFFYREMENVLSVSRVYFLEALRGNYNTVPPTTFAGGTVANQGTPLLDWMLQRSDIVTNLNYLRDPWPDGEAFDPEDPDWEPTGPEADPEGRHEVDGGLGLDEYDYGFLYSRYDAWVKLDSLWDGSGGLLWRPHEWYHLAVSFRSDAGTYHGDGFHPSLQPGISSAIDFYINGVWVDSEGTDGYLNNPEFYPTNHTTVSGRNWPGWYYDIDSSDTNLVEDDVVNDGSELPAAETTSPFYADGSVLAALRDAAEKDVYRQRRKWGSTLNELDPDPRLVVGAITRRQASDEQIQEFGDEGLAKEMFWFADGEFYAPANGTIDSLRITNKYLAIDRTGEGAIMGNFNEMGALDRIRQFARYNTRFMEQLDNPAGEELELGHYENGFANTWRQDVLVANIVWNEYRPRWDSARSWFLDYNRAPSVSLQFRTFEPEDTPEGPRRSLIETHQVRDNAEEVVENPIGNGYRARWDGDRVIGMGVAFGADEEPFVLPADGLLVYLAIFNNGTDPDFVANSTAILDDVKVTLITPSEFLSVTELFGR